MFTSPIFTEQIVKIRKIHCKFQNFNFMEDPLFMMSRYVDFCNPAFMGYCFFEKSTFVQIQVFYTRVMLHKSCNKLNGHFSRSFHKTYTFLCHLIKRI